MHTLITPETHRDRHQMLNSLERRAHDHGPTRRTWVALHDDSGRPDTLTSPGALPSFLCGAAMVLHARSGDLTGPFELVCHHVDTRTRWRLPTEQPVTVFLVDVPRVVWRRGDEWRWLLRTAPTVGITVVASTPVAAAPPLRWLPMDLLQRVSGPDDLALASD